MSSSDPDCLEAINGPRESFTLQKVRPMTPPGMSQRPKPVTLGPALAPAAWPCKRARNHPTHADGPEGSRQTAEEEHLLLFCTIAFSTGVSRRIRKATGKTSCETNRRQRRHCNILTHSPKLRASIELLGCDTRRAT